MAAALDSRGVGFQHAKRSTVHMHAHERSHAHRWANKFRFSSASATTPQKLRLSNQVSVSFRNFGSAITVQQSKARLLQVPDLATQSARKCCACHTIFYLTLRKCCTCHAVETLRNLCVAVPMGGARRTESDDTPHPCQKGVTLPFLRPLRKLLDFYLCGCTSQLYWTLSNQLFF